MSSLKSLEGFFDHILRILVAIACVILSLVMLSVCLEVFLRYFLNRPQVWVIELSEYALLYITFLSAAWVLKSDPDESENPSCLHRRRLYCLFSRVAYFGYLWHQGNLGPFFAGDL